jgi:photosystem II stability/assembly factor-like uncharacterized protein
MSRSTTWDALESLDPERSARHGSPAPQKLLGEILADKGGRIIELTSSHHRKEPSPRRRLRAPVIGGVVAVVVVVGVLVGVSRETSPSTHPEESVEAGTTIHWRLTAALLGPQYETASGNPDGVVGVTCSSGRTCVLSTGYGLDYAGGGTLFVSNDGGHNWRQSALPSGVAATTLASCPTDSWCAIGAGRLDARTGDPAAKKPMRDPELFVSHNGGRTWQVRSVPLPVDVQQLPASGNLPAETTYWPGEVDAVQCSTPEVCNLLGQAQTSGNGASGNGDELLFLHTSDGGIHWSSQVLPAIPGSSSYQLTLAPGESEAMSCPTATSCTIVATPWAPSEEVAWHTADAGHSWNVHPVPSRDFGNPSLSCPDTHTCWLGPLTAFGPTMGLSTGSPVPHLLRSENGGQTWSTVAVPAHLPSAQNGASSSQAPIHTPVYSGGSGNAGISCTSAESCIIPRGTEGIVETNDGGLVWKEVSLPSNVASVLQVSCTVHASCVAIGNPISGFGPNPFNGGSLILTNGKDRGPAR